MLSLLKFLADIPGRLWQKYRIRSDFMAYARSLGVRMGSNVRFYASNPSMFGSEPFLITLGNDVYITAGVQFITHDGGTLILRKEVPDLDYTAPIIIGNDVYIGMETIILPGVTIGNRCVIGAGSVVTKDIPDNSVAAGVPARVIKTTDEYLEGLKRKSLHCGHMGPAEKVLFLKEHFNITHPFKSLY